MEKETLKELKQKAERLYQLGADFEILKQEMLDAWSEDDCGYALSDQEWFISPKVKTSIFHLSESGLKCGGFAVKSIPMSTGIPKDLHPELVKIIKRHQFRDHSIVNLADHKLQMDYMPFCAIDLAESFLYATEALEVELSKKFDYYSKDFRELRHKVFLRDGEVCCKCGATPKPGVSLTIDHIKPVSKYPDLALDIENLQVLCWPCNQSKSNKHETDYRGNNGQS